MKFYSNIEGNLVVFHNDKVISFLNGILETEDQDLIDKLKKSYKFDNEEVTINPDTIDYESIKWHDLRKYAVLKGIKDIKDMTKDEIIKSLKEQEG